MSKKHNRLTLWLLMLSVLGALACGAGLNAASPTPPGGSIKVSDSAADELEKNVRNQIFDPGKKDFRISVTNQQATSYVTRRNTSLPLENPQIWFTQGKAFIRGTYTGLCLYHPDVLIIAAPKIVNKKMVVNVQQIYVGSFALPQDWLATVSKSVTDSIEDAEINLTFDKIDILENELVITGSKRTN
jgi:hypothetical protein